MEGNWAEAARYARQALEYRDYGSRIFTATCRWLEIEALLHSGEIERATNDLRHLREHFDNNPRHRIVYLRSAAVLALYHDAIDQARDQLHEAAELAAAIGLPGARWQILAALSELYQHQNDEDRALQMAAQSAAIVYSLAARLGDPELAGRLLASPAARQVLALPQTLMPA
jgi:hypothetical protein